MRKLIVLALAAVSLVSAAIVWTETTPLPRGSWRHACAAANGFVYFLGGGELPEPNCHFSCVNPDGTLGQWSETTALPASLGWFSADATSGHIYAVGGWNMSGLTAATNYAALDASGAVGSWTPATSLPTQLYTHGAIIVDSCLYVLGGCAGIGTPTVPDVRFARIQPDGSLGSWIETCDLPQPVRLMGVASHGEYLYSVGGRGNWDAAYDEVYYAERNPDGTLENWQSTTSLPSALDGTTCAAVSGRLFACGGIDASGAITDIVYSAPVNPDGSVGTWQVETPLPAARWAADGVAVKNRVYVTGGRLGDNGMSEVYYSNQLTSIAECPNSASPRLTASFCSGSVRFVVSAAGPAGVSIIAPSGRVCLHRSFASLSVGEHRLDLPGLTAGAYLLRAESRTGVSTGRFVVLH